MTETYDRMERIFHDLNDLVKTGEFRKHEVGFMLEFLEVTLGATKNMAKRAGFVQPAVETHATFEITVGQPDHVHKQMRWFGAEIPAHEPNDLSKGPCVEYYTIPDVLLPKDVKDGDVLIVEMRKKDGD